MRSDAVDLIRAILGEDCADDAAAQAFLDSARDRGVDPLRACAAYLDETVVLSRAARWTGLHWRATVPNLPLSDQSPVQLDRLAQVHGLRTHLGELDLTFCAPDFAAMLRLRTARLAKPSLAYRLCLVPDAALRRALARLAGWQLIDHAREAITLIWPFATAELDLGRVVRWLFVVMVLLVLGLALLAPYTVPLLLLPITLLLIGAPALLRLAALFVRRPPVPEHEARPADAELPVYSVLLPLRDEAHMVPQLVRAMRQLNYPSEKLDILFVVEDRSTDTMAAVETHAVGQQFAMIPVPDGLPRTKPKSLDVALPLCRGEFVVVYDAEDTPHPDQLWQAVRRFRETPDLACLQARLVIDNGSRHPLAALFAGEYAGLFGVLLPALARWRLPMPLGGTSNHFRLATLREIGGWDAFNVTEDADLGVRLARRRLSVDVFDSPTLEEAPTRFGAWTAQRSRWLKGWMQTFIVHNRRPLQLWRDLGARPMLAFEVLVLGMILAPLLHAGFLITLVMRLMLHWPIFDTLWSWSSFYIALFLFGYGVAIATALLGLLRHGMERLLLPQSLLPHYWTLMVPASLRALWELATQPFYWAKTEHAASPLRRLQPDQPTGRPANGRTPLSVTPPQPAE